MQFGKCGSPADGHDPNGSRRLAVEELEKRAVPAGLIDLIDIDLGQTTLGEGWRPHSGVSTFTFRLSTTPTAPVTVTLVADDSRLGYEHWEKYTLNQSNSFTLQPSVEWKRVEFTVVDDEEATGTVAASVDVILSSADPRFNGVLDDRIGLTITDNDHLVTSTANSGPGSLRQAITDAQSGIGTQTILFDEALSGQTIGLESTLTSAARLSIDASGLVEGLTIAPTASTPQTQFFDARADLTLKNLTLRGFKSAADGGAIRASGSRLEIYDSVFEGNEANTGGAIAIVSGSAFISNTRFGGDTEAASNTTVCEGGALYIGTGAGVSISNSTFAGNRASTGGGAIWNEGAVFVADTNFLANQAGLTGGAMVNRGRLRLTGSTLSGNSSETGGGVHLAWGEAYVVNSTISGNAARSQGGGVRITGGYSEVISSTIAGNQATVRGGGISTLGGATATLKNSIVAGNLAGPTVSQSPSDLEGIALAVNYSLIADPASALGVQHGQNGNIVGRADASGNRVLLPTGEVLFPLADNGGPTRTHALRPASPAIDQGLISPLPYPPINVLATDQRGTGYARIIGQSVDMGAVEYPQWQNSDSPTDVNGDAHITALDALTIINELHSRHYSNPQTGAIRPSTVHGEPLLYFDVNGDGYVTAVDALLVINRLHRLAVPASAPAANSSHVASLATGDAAQSRSVLAASAEGENDGGQPVAESSADSSEVAQWFASLPDRESKKTDFWPMEFESDDSL